MRTARRIGIVKHFQLEDMVVWDESVYPQLVADVVSRYGVGPFKVIGIRLHPKEVKARCPFAVTIELPGEVRQEFAGEWFKRAEQKSDAVCKIERHEVDLDPSVNVLHVELSKGDSCWPETFPDEAHLKAFLRGVSAGASLFGETIFLPPELPSSTMSRFVLKEIAEEGLEEFERSIPL